MKILLIVFVWCLILAFGVLLAFIYKGESFWLRTFISVPVIIGGMFLTKTLLNQEHYES